MCRLISFNCNSSLMISQKKKLFLCKLYFIFSFVKFRVKLHTGCPSAKADVSIGPDREKYLVPRQSSKLSMVMNSGNFR